MYAAELTERRCMHGPAMQQHQRMITLTSCPAGQEEGTRHLSSGRTGGQQLPIGGVGYPGDGIARAIVDLLRSIVAVC